MALEPFGTAQSTYPCVVISLLCNYEKYIQVKHRKHRNHSNSWTQKDIVTIISTENTLIRKIQYILDLNNERCSTNECRSQIITDAELFQLTAYVHRHFLLTALLQYPGYSDNDRSRNCGKKTVIIISKTTFTGHPGNVPSVQFFSKSSCTFCHSWTSATFIWCQPGTRRTFTITVFLLFLYIVALSQSVTYCTLHLGDKYVVPKNARIEPILLKKVTSYMSACPNHQIV